jgi:hypothetical protein
MPGVTGSSPVSSTTKSQEPEGLHSPSGFGLSGRRKPAATRASRKTHSSASSGPVGVGGPLTVVVRGQVLAQAVPAPTSRQAEYVYTLGASNLARRHGIVYNLPGIREYNRAVTGTDVAAFGAKVLLSAEDGDRGLPLARMAESVDPPGTAEAP